ncbi:hypothetical protein IV203_010343 [Nitzschia inconspicua]|uniref:Uncharacterized protein n=1 Tax=Nitzschia inconspicua TaxID=303405 RepID=A0A9K3PKT6_9STRA|nr:hypothetical protein IV203_010343 [Nitzschia inconspicua]
MARHLLLAVGAAVVCVNSTNSSSPSFHVRNPFAYRRRHLLDSLPTFSASDDGVNIVFPLIELQLFGTSGNALSEDAYDALQDATNLYLQDLLGNREWRTAATRTDAAATENKGQNSDAVPSQPFLSNVRTEVLSDRPLMEHLSGRVRRHLATEGVESSHKRGLEQVVVGNQLELQTTLTFQDSAKLIGSITEFPWMDTGVGNENDIGSAAAARGEDQEYYPSFVPLEEDLDAAFTEAFEDLSNSFFWVHLWTLLNQGSTALQSEFENLSQVIAKDATIPSTEESTPSPEEEQKEVVDSPSVNSTIANLDQQEDGSYAVQSRSSTTLNISLIVVLTVVVVLTICIFAWRCCCRRRHKDAISPIDIIPEIDSDSIYEEDSEDVHEEEQDDCKDSQQAETFPVDENRRRSFTQSQPDNQQFESKASPQILKITFPIDDKRRWSFLQSQTEHQVSIEA